jgi:iron complex transport system ATP-binding protein
LCAAALSAIERTDFSLGIEIKNLCFAYEDRTILHDISFTASDGALVAVLGPNGVGKSTLFRCMLGLLKPSSGMVLLGGRDINKLSRTEAAREIAYIPQSVTPTFNYTVLDMVLMGLTNRLSLLETPSTLHTEKAMACSAASGSPI